MSKRHLPTLDSDSAIKRRVRSSAFTVSQREFSKRLRFRDEDNNTYAVPLVGDPILQNYVARNMIDLKSDDLNKFNDDEEVPLSGDRVLLYFRKQRRRQVSAVPSGERTLIDLETHKLYSAKIELVVAKKNGAPGHVLLSEFVDTGRRSTSTT
jgi:hypothetical protein